VTPVLVAIGAGLGAMLRFWVGHHLDGTHSASQGGSRWGSHWGSRWGSHWGSQWGSQWGSRWGSHWGSHWVTHRGTLLVNLAGSFVLGLLVGAGPSPDGLALLGTGFCGGLTTYSAFAVQTRDQARDSGLPAGAAYGLGTVVLALVVCALGFALSVSPAGR
jgi:CrcB protein